MRSGKDKGQVPQKLYAKLQMHCDRSTGSGAPRPSHTLLPPSGGSQSQGQHKAGGISGRHAARENRRQHWATCVSLSKKYIHVELLLVLQWGGRQSGSVGQGRILHRTSLLPPLEKQRVGCVLYLLYLDLLVVDTHRGQGTGHLLLGAGKERRRDRGSEGHRQAGKGYSEHMSVVGPHR